MNTGVDHLLNPRYKVIIAGCRDFDDYNLLKEKVTEALKDIGGCEIISGNAKGADALGERYAKEHQIPLRLFPADWDKYGKRAGFIRNTEMANNATHLIAFWDGKSKGTKMMLQIAKEKGLKGLLVMIPPTKDYKF